MSRVNIVRLVHGAIEGRATTRWPFGSTPMAHAGTAIGAARKVPSGRRTTATF
jgi:hypothetical protein